MLPPKKSTIFWKYNLTEFVHDCGYIIWIMFELHDFNSFKIILTIYQDLNYTKSICMIRKIKFFFFS